jgi:hypothetical protein
MEESRVDDFKTTRSGDPQRSQSLIEGDTYHHIFHSRIFLCKGNQGLRFKNFEVQNSESTTVVDRGEGDPDC